MKTIFVLCALCSMAFAQGGTTIAGGANVGGQATLNGSTVTVASLAVTPNTAGQSANVNSTFGLTATVTLSDSSTANVTTAATWTISNGAIASFDSLTTTENMKCISAGTVTFTATYAGSSGTSTWICNGVLPPPPTPTSLTLTPQGVSINAGQAVQYTATETYSDGSTQNVTAHAQFISGTPSIATIGPLTATREVDCTSSGGGSSIISATNDGLSAATSTLTCNATLSSITVTPALPSILAGSTQAFLATCNYSDGSSGTCAAPTWSSSSTSIATITSGGIATGLAAGATTIKAQIGSVFGTTTLTVTSPGPPPPTQTSTTIAPVNATININTTLQYAATAVFSDGTSQPCTATWVSTSPSVATISTSGRASGVANGSTSIQGTCNSITGSTTLTVQTPAPTLSSVAVTPSNATQYNGSTVQFTATGTYSDGSTKNLTTLATWTSGTPAVATIGASTGLATCVANSGTTVITATFSAIPGTTNLSCQTATTNTGGNAYCTPAGTWMGPTSDGPAALPTACMYTAVSGTPSPGATRGPDTNTATVQADINAAACGDTILVTAGSTLNTITLPAKGCDNAHWITIKSTGVSNASFPAEGTRMTPCWGGVASLPGRPSYPCSSPANLLFTIVGPLSGNAIVVNGDHYRIIGAKITRNQAHGIVFGLVDITKSTAPFPNNIIFDRVWADGVEGTFPQTVSNSTETKRFLDMGQSNHIALIDSYVTNMYCDGSISICDSQAAAGGFGSVPNSGWGVYKFVNNHLEAAGMGIMMGGQNGPPLTPNGCTIMVNCNLDVTTDLEVRQNYFFKPLQWNGNTTVPVTVGWPVEKNGWEMKMGARALFEGNVVENTWFNAQGGACWIVAPKNQSNGPNGTAPTALTNDFTYRYNYCYNSAYGIGVFAAMDNGCNSCQSQGANRISIHDNVIGDNMNIGNLTASSTGDGIEILATNDSTGHGLNKVQNLNFSHNTTVKSIRSLTLFGGPTGNTQIVNLTMQNNLLSFGNFGFVSVGGGDCASNSGGSFYNALNLCVTTWTWDHNGIFSWNTGNAGSTLGRNWPTNGSGLGNSFITGTSSFGFTNYGTGNSNFNPGNYTLLPSSPLHNAGSDGKDLGADINTLTQKIAGVRQ